ncbi:MAG TPA: efflux RND transporter permease subunit, partial [Membranihabitans sp.]|nr:efflux RND transporter permease subunit [Membranihabitans sp.]
GYSPIEAAKYGAGEVAVPIIASTATTIAAFVPIAFWPGLFGEFMKYLPITLILVLFSSLLVALVINPVFTSRFMKMDRRAEDSRRRMKNRRGILFFALGCVVVAVLMHFMSVTWARNLLAIAALITLLNFFLLRPGSFYFQERVMPALERGYHNFIKRALYRRMPAWVLAGTFGLLIFSIMALTLNMPKVIFFPNADPLYINVFVELPLGRDIQSTDRAVRAIEGQINQVLDPHMDIVESVLTQIGENTSDPNSPPEPGTSPHKARITVTFVPTEERGGVSTAVIMNDIRSQLDHLPGVQIVVDQNASGPPAGKPINIELQSEDMDELALLSERVINYINDQNIGGIEELKTDVQIGKPELLVHIDRESARRFELSTGMIASAIRTSIYGKEVSKYKVGEEEYPIQLRLDSTYRNQISSILNQRITFRDPASGLLTQVPISSVAQIEYSSTYSAIKRKDLERVITVYSNVLAGYNANEVVSAIRQSLLDFDFPDGVNYEFTGEQQQQAEDMAFLQSAFTLSIFLIFLILVSQFNSIVSPFIIILSVLFSTIGVFLGYALTGRDISVIFTGVGIISLAGIVVNNAIILVDYTDLLIKRKVEELGKDSMWDLEISQVKEMVIEGGTTRLRPVLLTAITTILGLIPLAIGLNIDFFTLISDLEPNIYIGGDNTVIWGPLAWTVIYGLVFSTFLTLIVVPAMYWLAYRMKLWFQSRKRTVEQ